MKAFEGGDTTFCAASMRPRNGSKQSVITRLGGEEAASIMHGLMSQPMRVVLFLIM